MQFLLDNLMFYLHVDVIDVQYARLKERLETSTEFEQVQRAHREYLQTMARQAFLRSPVITRAFEHVFRVCLHFCELVQNAERSQHRFDHIQQAFEQESCFLFTILSKKTGGTASASGSPHLAQLVTRINFNYYYQSHAATLGM